MLTLFSALCLHMMTALAGGGYTVGPRDTLHIEFFGHAELSRDVVVSESGLIRLAHLEALDVSGLSVEEVNALVTTSYSVFYREPQLDVTVKVYRSQPVEVVGAVKRAGTYYLEGPTTVRQVLTEAGWVLADRSSGEVHVQRSSGETEVYTVNGLSAGQDVPVAAMDTVTVPEGQFIFVDGEVAKPGAILFSEGMTVSQAMARAGGASPLARLRKAHLLRDSERINVNLKRILDGRDADIVMQAGDQLILKESPL